ncbi:MAG: tetraacyldisaccharide 4'-kinase [Planctomycetes bacterium]|jgi:tetraacyldisaccharide 4'-kinase|nr:tetraacyldisaccharide 4'-kinase [Planctomycetota bacterium]MCP4837896.1 tetraacyldisaccharide 4'-kinase [Planctomycetota bacterium]
MFLLNPIARVYGAAIAARNRRFDRGDRVTDVGVPVISVGNVTAGGTGKTPTVQWLVRTLMEVGRTPAVAMRGYRARPDGISDEAAEHMRLLRGVPVLVDPDRATAISQHLDHHPECDVVVLDDGFQHRFVSRKADVVLVDARRPMSEQRLLPEGRLREPWSSLRRATAIIVTHADQPDPQLAAEITEFAGAPPIAWCHHVWRDILRIDAGGEAVVPVSELDGCSVITRFGVGSSEGVLSQVKAAGGRVVADFPAKDHSPVTPSELKRLEQASTEAEAIVVTGKDWASLGPLVDWDHLGVPVLVPRLEIEFVAGEPELKRHIVQSAEPESA